MRGPLACMVLLAATLSAAQPVSAQTRTPFPQDLSAAQAGRELGAGARVAAERIANRSPQLRPARSTAVRQAATAVASAAAQLSAFSPPDVPFLQRRGHLTPPVRDARLIAGYGHRRRPDSPTRSRHHGLSWRVPAGVPVSAVAPGVVVASAFIEGLGGVIVVDHGDDFHTVYGQLLELDVLPGQSVEAGGRLGRGGNVSTFGEREVYFEIRHQGVAEDPAPWLAR